MIKYSFKENLIIYGNFFLGFTITIIALGLSERVWIWFEIAGWFMVWLAFHFKHYFWLRKKFKGE